MSLKELLTEQERAIREGARRGVDDVAEEALNHIRRRTSRGIGTNERRFTPYSPGYAEEKYGSRGRTQPVTLIRSGEMLSSLYVRPARSGARSAGYRREITFRSRAMERRGRYHQDGTRRMPQRRWFGLTTRFARQMRERFGSIVRRSIPSDRRRRTKVAINL